MYTSEWENKKWTRAGGCLCLTLFVLIPGKLMLCVDRTSYHLSLSSAGIWIDLGGVRLSVSRLTTAQHLTPCFLNCCQSTSKRLFPCQMCTDSCGTGSFEVRWLPLTSEGLHISSFFMAHGGQENSLINLVQLCSNQCNYLQIRLIQLGLSPIYNTNSIPRRQPLCHVNHCPVTSVSDNKCSYY